VRGANVQGQTRSHSRGIAGSVQTVRNLHTLGDGPGLYESVACPFHEPLDSRETAKTLTLGVSSSGEKSCEPRTKRYVMVAYPHVFELLEVQVTQKPPSRTRAGNLHKVKTRLLRHASRVQGQRRGRASLRTGRTKKVLVGNPGKLQDRKKKSSERIVCPIRHDTRVSQLADVCCPRPLARQDLGRRTAAVVRRTSSKGDVAMLSEDLLRIVLDVLLPVKMGPRISSKQGGGRLLHRTRTPDMTLTDPIGAARPLQKPFARRQHLNKPPWLVVRLHPCVHERQAGCYRIRSREGSGASQVVCSLACGIVAPEARAS
jgi:hypothetical protein